MILAAAKSIAEVCREFDLSETAVRRWGEVANLSDYVRDEAPAALPERRVVEPLPAHRQRVVADLLV